MYTYIKELFVLENTKTAHALHIVNYHKHGKEGTQHNAPFYIYLFFSFLFFWFFVFEDISFLHTLRGYADLITEHAYETDNVSAANTRFYIFIYLFIFKKTQL